jgi:non-heme chloroperoxidase
MKKILIGLLLLILGVFLYLQYKVYQINNAPAEYSYETLSAQPIGNEEYITTTDGSKLRTLSAGDGPTVVLAHGFGGSIHDWNLVFEKLVNHGYHVIAFDQRGHHKSSIGTDGITSASMSGDYKSVFDHFQIKNAILVGHSMGGFLGIHFLLNHPEMLKTNVKGFLIMASFAGDVNKDNPQNEYQIPLITNGYIDKILKNNTLATLFQASFIGKPYKAIITTALDNLKDFKYMALVPILKAFMADNNYPKLSQITIPCTILVGTADKTTPAFHAENMAKGIANSKLLKIEGKGHLLNWEAPNEVVNQIIELAKK